MRRAHKGQYEQEPTDLIATEITEGTERNHTLSIKHFSMICVHCGYEQADDKRLLLSSLFSVIPANAGIQTSYWLLLDPRFFGMTNETAGEILFSKLVDVQLAAFTIPA